MSTSKSASTRIFKDKNLFSVVFITIHCGDEIDLLETYFSILPALKSEWCYRYVIYDSSSFPCEYFLSNCVDKVSYFHGNPRNGISNALNNSAIKVYEIFPEAQYICYIHSGDTLFYIDFHRISIILSNSQIIDSRPPLIFYNWLLGSSSTQYYYKKPFPDRLYSGMTVCHIGTFIPVPLHFLVSGYDVNLLLAMDYKFFFDSVYMKNWPFVLGYDSCLVKVDNQGVSSINPSAAIFEVNATRSAMLRLHPLHSLYLLCKSLTSSNAGYFLRYLLGPNIANRVITFLRKYSR